MPIVQHPVAGHIAASMHAQEQRHDDQAGGPVIVDLDEAIFGLNAMAREAVGIVQSGIGQAAAHWQAEAVSMGTDPMGWLSASAYEGNWSAIASTIAVSAVSLPFAALAIKGGIDEIRHGRAERQRLKLEKEQLMARHTRATAGEQADGADAVPAAASRGAAALQLGIAHKDAARLARIEIEMRAANATVSIGAAASTSGTLMSTNALSDIVLQPLLKCCAKGMAVAAWLAQHGCWSAIVAVVGTIGTLVLAPLSAVSALVLGSSFVHRSRVLYREFVRAKGLLLASLSNDDAAAVSPVASTPYGRFLTAKLGKRAAFMLRFRNWSVGFLTGATTYTAGALAKTALVGAALFGLGVIATNPVILVVLTIAVTVGAFVMAAGSLNFILNLGKAKRHESYEGASHPQLDRGLLDALDPVGMATAGPTQPLGKRRGFRMRASLYRRLVMQETVMQGIVGDAAKKRVKRHAWTDRSDKTGYRTHLSSAAPARRKDAIAAVRAAAILARELLSGKGPARAWHAACLHYAKHCASLTAYTLAKALRKDPGLHERLCALARIQSSVVRERIRARVRLKMGHAKPPAGVDGTWFAEQHERLVSDMNLVANLTGLLHDTKARAEAAGNAAKPVQMDVLFIARFLESQQKMGLCTHSTKAHDKPDAATQYAELADYLIHQAPKSFATLRGSLFACEMDAARASAIPQPKGLGVAQ